MKKVIKDKMVPYNIKVPSIVDKAIKDYVKDKKNDDNPSFSASAFMKMSAIKELKHQGYLDKEKNYL